MRDMNRSLAIALGLFTATILSGCGSSTSAPPPPLSVSVSPTSAGIPVNATQQFTATLQNDPSNKGVTWALTQDGASCSSECGTLSATSSASGTPTTYTAPATVPVNPSVTLTAASTADPTKSASATVTVTPPPPSDTLTLVSGPSPFPPGCDHANSDGTNYENGEVEARVAIDPTNSSHLVGIYQQDRWSDGEAHGLMTAVSRDGGTNWKLGFAHLARCSGGNAGNGADYERVTDPWVTISPDGTVFQSGLSENVFNGAMLVARSTDGGDRWSELTSLIVDTDPTVADDKDSITADPQKPGYVYAIWSRYVFTDFRQQVLVSSPAWFSRTTDSGSSWEPARDIYDPPAGFYALGHEIVVLPDGSLVDMFFQYDDTSSAFYTIRSTDQGLTWSQPALIDHYMDIGVIDVKTGELVRGGVPNIAVNPTTGSLYFVWMDARFSGGLRDGIAFSTSTDGGVSWSPALQVNQAPNVQAFAPSIAVTANGRIAVTYYDFRDDNADPSVLLTNYWRITSADGGHTWQEIPLSASFDLRNAPKTGLGYMVTDYEGLVASAESFVSFFVAANSGNTANPTDVFATSTEKGIGVNTSTNAHVEVNFHPLTVEEQMRLRRAERRPRVEP
jgi:Neuraminidase (sialidase)